MCVPVPDVRCFFWVNETGTKVQNASSEASGIRHVKASVSPNTCEIPIKGAGKNLGRTKLTDISPKKTVEGAMGGLASSVTVAILMWKLTHWPPTALSAAGLGVSA